MQSEASSIEMARKLLVHSTLDQIFSAQYDVSRLPQLISHVGIQYIGCEFVSMWRYEPGENVLYNVVARSNLSAEGYAGGGDIPAGSLRLKVSRGDRRGIMLNLAAEVLAGRALEDMPMHLYIVNDRPNDPRTAGLTMQHDRSVIHSAMYAAVIYNGFKGMMVALNHERNAFSVADWEILKILASKAAIVLDNIEQRKQLEESARLALLGRAIDLVRHELKAPLTAIKGAATIIKRTLNRLSGKDDDRALIEEMSNMISSEVERNVRMLREIQNYCSPRLELTLTPGHLDEFLRNHASHVAAAAGDKRPEFVFELHDEDVELCFSADHLLEVLRNFVRNSAESGSSSVHFRTAVADGRVVLEVIDDGGGVDEAVLGTLFRPYESYKTHNGGSGLGLFISRRIIEEGHCGRISAHNRYEGGRRRGLTIRIELPVPAAEHPEPALPNGCPAEEGDGP